MGSGHPLPRGEREELEARFGQDLSAVRVHTDSAAATLAERLHARALTVGTDIAFAAGEYRPGTADGRMLLAHELTHVLQQTIGLEQAPPAAAVVQRACPPTACPPVAVPVTALNPVWKQAEICVQETYEATHPASRRGVSLGFNLDWVYLRGGSPAEQDALRCLRGNFTAKSGMYQGEPDIWDFRNATMYEITTASGASFRIGKLAAEIALANKLTGPAECGGLMFAPGTWIPPGPCYAIGGDLYISVVNTAGVLVYAVMRDATKEAALAAMLAALGVIAKGTGTVAKGAGKKVPVYAAASLVAAVVLLGSGRATAQLGPGTEEPLVQLFQAVAASGTPVPPEVQQMIESDPALKARIEEAMRKGGDPSAAQEELNRELLAVIAANKDQFSTADLELLLAVTGTAQGRLPRGQQTVDTVRRILADQRHGAGRGTDGGGRAAVPGAPKSAPTDGVPAEGRPADRAASPEIRAEIAKANAPVRRLWEAIVGAGSGPGVTAGDARRFVSEVPSDLSNEQVDAVIAALGPVAGTSFDRVLAQLKRAIEDLRTRSGAAGGAAGVDDVPSRGATTATDDSRLVKELAAAAAAIDPATYARGDYDLTWRNEKDGVIEATIRGRTGRGQLYAGTVRARIDDRAPDGRTLMITFLTSSPFVDPRGQIVLAANALKGTRETVQRRP
ncbi:protein of unknown function [Geodermatophilus poikilotrophus]|uniref:eCIS core domain-containing protein n=2 Tax=Geodermatophilus poikilotrophus TaxID=1333667 RepID=A0A1I0GVE7_9ACTN|nr:DUF4157 domain-containing protein [Geodermatophilus poikilotrophus]SET75112.1 protein of unknown function [Geodermatophilus poikilotrophus]